MIERVIITYLILFMITIGCKLSDFQQSNSHIYKEDVPSIYFGSMAIAFGIFAIIWFSGLYIFKQIG